MALLLATGAQAQTNITIGTGTAGNGTTTYPCPLQDRFEAHRAQYLYRASELTAAGMGQGVISAIRFTVTSVGTAGVIEGYTIKITQTPVATLSATTWEPGATTVYGPVNYQPVAGVNSFTLATPFFWNGTDNILVEVCNGTPAAVSGSTWSNNPVVTWTTGLSFNGSHTYRVDGIPDGCGVATTTNTGTQTTRPNIIFGWTAASACSGTPTPGTISGTANVCTGQPVSLSMSGGTLASGITYQWQSSTNNSTWTNIPSATSTSYSGTQSANTYYRVEMRCSGGSPAYTSSWLVTTPAQVSGTFTINKTQPTGSGNFNSFNDAYNYIKCGINGAVVFNVVSGTGPYNEQLIIDPVPGASAANTITFNGNGDSISFRSTNSNERAVIKLNGADHFIFDSLVVNAGRSDPNEYGWGFHLMNGADSNIIRKCVINSSTTSNSTIYAGIVISGSASSAVAGPSLSDYNVIKGNTINGGAYGVAITGTVAEASGFNQITNNIITDWYTYGVYLEATFTTLVEGNDISRPTRTNSPATSYGIYLTNLQNNSRLSKNFIHGVFDAQTTTTNDFYGIYHTGVVNSATREGLVVNNVIYDIKGNGTIYGIYNNNSDNIWYYYNTISLDNTTSTGLVGETTRGFYQLTEAAGIEFKNNLISITRGGAGPKHAIYMGTPATQYESNHNNFYVTTGPTFFTGYSGGADRLTLADWRTATSKDANSVAVAPIFTSVGTGNLKPNAAALNDKGIPIAGISTDVLGISRHATTPDIGAYEFDPGGCVAPPTPGNAVSSVTGIICPNTSVALNLVGNSEGEGQTYRWQSAPSLTGPWTPLGTAAQPAPGYSLAPGVTAFYRAAITCSGVTVYSDTIQVEVAVPLPAGTYTINSTVATGGTNYKSFNDAYTRMKCGIAGPVVFSVVPGTGTYVEQLIIDSIPGASAINTVTFLGNGDTLRYNAGTNTERAVIKLIRADHIRFDSLVIDARGAANYGWGVQLINNADSNVFSRCRILVNATSTSLAYQGIVVSSSATSGTTGSAISDSNSFIRNTIIGGYYGITLNGSANEPLKNNVIRGNTFQNFYETAVYINRTENTIVEGNDMSRPSRVADNEFNGIYVTNPSTGLTLTANRIHNPFGGDLSATDAFYGIYLDAADATATSPMTISNNIIYNVNGEGSQYGIYNTGSDHVRTYHNTISLDNQSSSHGSSIITRGLYMTTTATTGVEFKNNIVTVKRTGAGTRHAIYLVSATSTAVSDYNNFYVSGDPANTYIGYRGAAYATLAAWQAATSQDAHSFAYEPYYLSPTTGNLEPQMPALENKGTPVGITTDIRGNARSATTPDLGAYEFLVAPCINPPNPGSVSITPGAVCLGRKVDLRLNGSSSGIGQTYQWQFSTTAAGTYTNMGSVMQWPDTTIEVTGPFYYRVAITCGGNTVYTAPMQMGVLPGLPGGVYTINPALPTGGTNYNTFKAAVAAMDCGINDDVTFNVKPGTYNEQVRIPRINGAGVDARVTFQSENGNAASVILTYASTKVDTNYVLKLDSASYLTLRNLTVTATGSTYGRAIELAGTASYDSIVNCVVNTPTTTSTATDITGIYADDLRGGDHVIKHNTVNNGSNGIYFSGLSTATATTRNTIDSNTVNGSYYYGIYVGLNKRSSVSGNVVNRTSPAGSTNYAMYLTNVDTAFRINNNIVNINNVTSTTTYGMYLTGNNGSATEPGRIANNRVLALDGNTGTIYGLYLSGALHSSTVNNVVALKTTGASSYGLYVSGGSAMSVLNNSVQNNSVAGTSGTDVAAYFAVSATGSGPVDVRNNIFSHTGGGVAMHTTDMSFVPTDYNMYYTSGTSLIREGSTTDFISYGTLRHWQDATTWDMSSIVYKPAFVSESDLKPDVAVADVWAIHGRGVQVPGNDRDFNDNVRPTALTAGVPDLGAYEFLPTSTPPALQPVPATAAPGVTQTFMFGTDTVAKVTWNTGGAVPSAISVRRYSGVLPPGLASGQQSMYFYNDVDLTATGTINYSIKQFYIDSWQGFIPREQMIKLGRTNATGAWLVEPNTILDSIANVMSNDAINYLDRITGLSDGTLAAPPPVPPMIYVQQVDSSNKGRHFRVAYGHHYGFSANSQDMVLYLSTEQAANVQVRINGTSYVRNYSIPANTAIVSYRVPKAGMFDSRITDEGKFDRTVSITSDVPIVAYAHIYDGSNSGASMLLPTGVYGNEYQSLNARQYYPTGGAGSYSWFYVIADRDNTVVEITPSVATKGGRPAGVPFTVTLNAGEVYNVMGTISGNTGTDLTGSRIRSVPNSIGKCYPIAVFSGSSRTAICYDTNGDNMIQQMFPSQAWGTKYLTFATANSSTAINYNSNVFRVMVKDPTTVVKHNGVTLNPATMITPGNYYQFHTTRGSGANGAVYVEADKPVLVSQYMVSTNADECPGIESTGNGDPEMIYISPLEQGIRKAVFYTTDQSAINSNYVNVVVPTAKLSTLRIDGLSNFTDVFAHPHLAGYTCVRQNLGATARQHVVECDTSFTAITYGLGGSESYGYNTGTLVKNLNALTSISNTLNLAGTENEFTCPNTPFRFSVLIPVQPTSLVWQFSQSNISPNTDVTQTNPVPTAVLTINGRTYYRYTLAQDFQFATPGTYNVPLVISHPSFEGCNNTMERIITITVNNPAIDFTTAFQGCVGNTAQFTAAATNATGLNLYQWNWLFSDGTTATGQNASKQYLTPGTFNVRLRAVASDGCVGEKINPVTVNALPTFAIVEDTAYNCLNSNITFSIQNPATGVTYNWYDAPTGGNLVHSGASFTTPLSATTVRYYAEAVQNGCPSAARQMVVGQVLPNLAVPAVVVDTVSTDMIRFRWNAVPNATGYEVSMNNGSTWTTPSSGATGLTHTVTGLMPMETATILVRVLGGCNEVRSLPVTGRALPDDIFIPNSFSPNGDGLNDVLKVYGYTISEMQFMVFNQWGEKIFESRSQATGWDGTHRGKVQPSGVYIYVCRMVLKDGSVVNRKGSINLIR
jgi:gliding motility-associated-like protein